VMMDYCTYDVELAFVITFHKCQGRTLQKVILDLNKQTGQGNVNYSSLYVGLSRVRKGDDIRILPFIEPHNHSLFNKDTEKQFRDAADRPLEHLKQLKPPDYMARWYRGFDPLGIWSINQSKLLSRNDPLSRAERTHRKRVDGVVGRPDRSTPGGFNAIAYHPSRMLMASEPLTDFTDDYPMDPVVEALRARMNAVAFNLPTGYPLAAPCGVNAVAAVAAAAAASVSPMTLSTQRSRSRERAAPISPRKRARTRTRTPAQSPAADSAAAAGSSSSAAASAPPSIGTIRIRSSTRAHKISRRALDSMASEQRCMERIPAEEPSYSSRSRRESASPAISAFITVLLPQLAPPAPRPVPMTVSNSSESDEGSPYNNEPMSEDSESN
jgi:hypothetical protein